MTTRPCPHNRPDPVVRTQQTCFHNNWQILAFLVNLFWFHHLRSEARPRPVHDPLPALFKLPFSVIGLLLCHWSHIIQISPFPMYWKQCQTLSKDWASSPFPESDTWWSYDNTNLEFVKCWPDGGEQTSCVVLVNARITSVWALPDRSQWGCQLLLQLLLQ